jgi:hypothetical protein
MGTNPGFDLTKGRPWRRISAAARALSTTVLGKGELAITETGQLFTGDGTTALKDRDPIPDAASLRATYPTKGDLVLNAADSRFGTQLNQVSLNAAIAAVAANGQGRVLASAKAGQWSLDRNISSDQKSGGVYVGVPGVTLESDGAVFNLTNNSDFIKIQSQLGSQVTITGDIAPADRSVTVQSSSTFTVGQWAFLRLGQASYDAFEPDTWLYAKVTAIPDSTHVTFDRPMGITLAVASVANAAQKSVAPITSFAQDVAIDGTWNLVNPATGNANAESGLNIQYGRNLRVGTIVATTPGAAAVGAQFVDNLRIDSVRVVTSHAQNGQASKGRGIGFSESHGVHVGILEIEDFERSIIVMEARCEGIRIDQVVASNTYASRSNSQALISVLGNSKLSIGQFHLTGNESVVYSDGNTAGNECSIDEFYAYTPNDPTFPDLGIVKNKRFVRGKLFTRKTKYRRIIPLINGMNSTFTLPTGLSTRFDVYASSTTGLGDVYVGSTSGLSTSFVSSLISGGTYSYLPARGFGSGYPVNNDTGKRFIVTTGSTVPVGAYMVIEMDYWADPSSNGTDAGIQDAYYLSTPAHAATHRVGGVDELLLLPGQSNAKRAEPVPWWACTSNINNVNGALQLVYFTANDTTPWDTISAAAGSTASAGATLARLGVYSLDASGNGTLVAATANDTTILQGANQTAKRSLASAFTPTIGARYALGLLVVGTTTAGNYKGVSITAGMAVNPPRAAGILNGQTDLPANFTAGQPGTTGSVPWLAVGAAAAFG